MERSFGTEISGNRGPSGELSEVQRAAIIAEAKAGKPKKQIATDFSINRSTVYSTINRFKQCHTLKSLSRSGRPEKLTPRQKRYVLRVARQHPQIEYAHLKLTVAGLDISTKTLQRLLKKHHIKK